MFQNTSPLRCGLSASVTKPNKKRGSFEEIRKREKERVGSYKPDEKPA